VIIGLNVRAEARTLQYGKFQGRQFSGQIPPLRPAFGWTPVGMTGLGIHF
jgi:hypothetical protein